MISRREWLNVVIFAALLLLIVSLPYSLAWAQQGDERVFSGFLFGVDDGNSYIGKMRLGAQGRWDFFLFYTHEDHEGANLIFLPYILPGQIVGRFIDSDDPALTGALIGVFHLLRIIFGGLLIFVMYRFIAEFVEGAGMRLLALLLATVAGGFGWLLLFTGDSSPPPEFFIPEGFTLQILLGLPHLALARAALLGGLLLLIRSLEHPAWSLPTILAGLCWLVVGLAVPFYFVIVYCILGAWGLASWLRMRRFPWTLFWRALIAAAITLPLFAYYSLVFSSHPAFAQWSAQNILESPPPLHYMLAYLPLGLLAILGGRYIWHKTEPHYLLLLGWPLLVPLLVYLPINVQRRLAEAVIVPLAILAVYGLRALAQHWRLLFVTLFATLPSSLILLLGAYGSALGNSPQVFYPAGQIAALDWLNQQAQPGQVVLSTLATGNLIPAYTNLRAYVGHGPETLDALAKRDLVQALFADKLPAEERARLYAQVDYLFYGPNERQYAAATAAWQAGLRQIYLEGNYEIYVMVATVTGSQTLKVVPVPTSLFTLISPW